MSTKQKIKSVIITRDTFIGGELFEADPTSPREVGRDLDEKTAIYLIRIGKAVPSGPQTKGNKKAK